MALPRVRMGRWIGTVGCTSCVTVGNLPNALQLRSPDKVTPAPDKAPRKIAPCLIQARRPYQPVPTLQAATGADEHRISHQYPLRVLKKSHLSSPAALGTLKNGLKSIFWSSAISSHPTHAPQTPAPREKHGGPGYAGGGKSGVFPFLTDVGRRPCKGEPTYNA